MSSDMIIRDGMTIRRYRAADADAVTELWSRASRQADPGSRTLREAHPVQAENWVAERDSTVIGLLGMPTGECEGEAVITALCVAPEAQGCGTGKELVEHAAALRGALVVEIFEGDPRARRFYERLGFTERARRADDETGHVLIALHRPAPLKSVSWLHVREGRLLSVRTRGNDTFYLPGGKYEPGETAAQALSRELSEELGLLIPEEELSEAFVIHDIAHGKGGRRLHMTCFIGGPQDIDPAPGREIAEYAWFDRREARERCAPAHSQVVDRLIAEGRMAA